MEMISEELKVIVDKFNEQGKMEGANGDGRLCEN
jgi:hypothetical protein